MPTHIQGIWITETSKMTKIAKNRQKSSKNHEKSIKNEILGQFWQFQPFCLCPDQPHPKKCKNLGISWNSQKWRNFGFQRTLQNLRFCQKCEKMAIFTPFQPKNPKKWQFWHSAVAILDPQIRPSDPKKLKSLDPGFSILGNFDQKLMKNRQKW